MLDTDVKRIGLRIVKLDISDIHLPDERGKFCFVVNGRGRFSCAVRTGCLSTRSTAAMRRNTRARSVDRRQL
ncbi:MAG: hypothetical protein ACLTTP_08070 [Alistipes ihumii]